MQYVPEPLRPSLSRNDDALRVLFAHGGGGPFQVNWSTSSKVCAASSEHDLSHNTPLSLYDSHMRFNVLFACFSLRVSYAGIQLQGMMRYMCIATAAAASAASAVARLLRGQRRRAEPHSRRSPPSLSRMHARICPRRHPGRLPRLVAAFAAAFAAAHRSPRGAAAERARGALSCVVWSLLPGAWGG